MILFLALGALYILDDSARDSEYVPVCRDRLKKRGFMLLSLPRTTERPVRKRGDEPRTIVVGVGVEIVRGECSDLSVRAAPQSHGRKSVVRGLLAISFQPSTMNQWVIADC